MMKISWIASTVLLFTFCTGAMFEEASRPAKAKAVSPDALRLARELMIVDTHLDVPYRLSVQNEDISKRTQNGNFDYPRAKEGGLDGAFLAIYVPASYQETDLGEGRVFADGLIDMVYGFERRWPEIFSIARSPGDFESNFGRGVLSLALGMENGAGLGDDLKSLKHFFDRGIRYITLVHSKNNLICDSSYDTTRTWHGLSPFGRQVVKEMNRLGIMVDISHVSDETFYQVLEVSTAPVIASHSSCRVYTPGWERNMSDEMIRAIADKGGVVQISFGAMFLNEEYREASTIIYETVSDYLESHELRRDDPEAEEFIAKVKSSNPLPRVDVSHLASHIDHVVKLVGIDHVGLGSDYDGVGDSLPVGMEDVSTYPLLLQELLERGYTKEEIGKICSGNFFRVWAQVEDVARTLRD